MATGFYDWIYDDQQPRRRDSSWFSMETEQKVEKIASRFREIAELLLENRLLSREERWSRLEASRQQSLQDYKRNGSYSGRRGGHPFKHPKRFLMYRCTSAV